jgi:hypothetical protein
MFRLRALGITSEDEIEVFSWIAAGGAPFSIGRGSQ